MSQQTAIAAAIAKAVATALAGKPVTKARRKGYHQKSKGAQKLTEAEKAAYMTANDAECIKVFQKAGYKDVQPRINVLTYNKWIENGFKVKKGQKSVRVNGFSLFHQDQVEALTVTAESPAANSVAA